MGTGSYALTCNIRPSKILQASDYRGLPLRRLTRLCLADLPRLSDADLKQLLEFVGTAARCAACLAPLPIKLGCQHCRGAISTTDLPPSAMQCAPRGKYFFIVCTSQIFQMCDLSHERYPG